MKACCCLRLFYYLIFSYIFELLWPMPCLMLTAALVLCCACSWLTLPTFAFSSNCKSYTYGCCKPDTWVECNPYGLLCFVWTCVVNRGCCYAAHGFWCYDELFATRYCCGITSLVVPCIHRKIYVYLKIWIWVCLQGTFVPYCRCVPV